jgi:hypothetical protein
VNTFMTATECLQCAIWILCNRWGSLRVGNQDTFNVRAVFGIVSGRASQQNIRPIGEA